MAPLWTLIWGQKSFKLGPYLGAQILQISSNLPYVNSGANFRANYGANYGAHSGANSGANFGADFGAAFGGSSLRWGGLYYHMLARPMFDRVRMALSI